MAKKGKSFSLSETAIKKVLDVQKEHKFDSESAALEYILVHQPNESKIKELIYEIMFKIMSENSISFNGPVQKNNITEKVDNEVENILKNATADIFNNMPD